MRKHEKLKELLRLSHELGRGDLRMAILGEGNTSVKLDDATFLIKTSGSSLQTLSENEVVECRSSVILGLLDKSKASDEDINALLMMSRLDAKRRKPSVEVLFHAYLLTLPDVEYVGHTHAIAVNQVLCSPRAKEFAAKRLFPDEVVCCDVESVFVEYTDPGLPLAQAIRNRTELFLKKYNRSPRVILIANHGIITLGRSVEGVLVSMLMAEKTASIWLGAAAVGGPRYLTKKEVDRIAGRSDEKIRQQVLKL